MADIHGNVLVIEDDNDTGAMLVQLLSSAGYGVRLCKSRDDASRALENYVYEHIILDYAMAGMTIEEFLKRFDGRVRKPHLIVLSAVLSRDEAEALGIQNWLPKPFRPEDLLDILKGLSSGIIPRPKSTRPPRNKE